MSSNPFQSPRSDKSIVGVNRGSIEELRKVATYQKGILFCILIQLLNIIAAIAINVALGDQAAALLLAINCFSLLVGIASTVFVFLLAINVYSTGVGILLGILALIPCIGLIVLLVVNGKATSVLRLNGIRVGLMGADSSQI